MGGVEGCGVGDAEGFQEDGGGRINPGVGTCDAVAAFAKHAGQGGHGGAANADHVDVFRWVS